jgi:hypothetical protein
MNTSGYINLADLMTELKTRKISQKEFLKIYKVPVAFARPSGRGFACYIDKAGAEKIRKAIAKEQPIKMTRTTSTPRNDALVAVFAELESMNAKLDRLLNMWER